MKSPSDEIRLSEEILSMTKLFTYTRVFILLFEGSLFLLVDPLPKFLNLITDILTLTNGYRGEHEKYD